MGTAIHRTLSRRWIIATGPVGPASMAPQASHSTRYAPAADRPLLATLEVGTAYSFG